MNESRAKLSIFFCIENMFFSMPADKNIYKNGRLTTLFTCGYVIFKYNIVPAALSYNGISLFYQYFVPNGTKHINSPTDCINIITSALHKYFFRKCLLFKKITVLWKLFTIRKVDNLLSALLTVTAIIIFHCPLKNEL
jgi:hypothetical protein